MDRVFKANGGKNVGESTTPFGTTDFTSQMTEVKAVKPNAVILNLMDGISSMHKGVYEIGIGQGENRRRRHDRREQIGRPLGYAR